MATSAKAEKVLLAATELFMRYGYARVTMADLAQASGMSRPALYLVFPGKEEIFNAVVETIDRRAHARLRQNIAELPTMHARLLHVCQDWFGNLHRLQINTPDSRDMDDLVFPVVRDVYERLQSLLAEILSEGAAQAGAAIDAEALARLLVFSIRGCREVARDASDLQASITLQVKLVAAAVDNVQDIFDHVDARRAAE